MITHRLGQAPKVFSWKIFYTAGARFFTSWCPVVSVKALVLGQNIHTRYIRYIFY